MLPEIQASQPINQINTKNFCSQQQKYTQHCNINYKTNYNNNNNNYWIFICFVFYQLSKMDLINKFTSDELKWLSYIMFTKYIHEKDEKYGWNYTIKNENYTLNIDIMKNIFDFMKNGDSNGNLRIIFNNLSTHEYFLRVFNNKYNSLHIKLYFFNNAIVSLNNFVTKSKDPKGRLMFLKKYLNIEQYDPIYPYMCNILYNTEIMDNFASEISKIIMVSQKFDKSNFFEACESLWLTHMDILNRNRNSLTNQITFLKSVLFNHIVKKVSSSLDDNTYLNTDEKLINTIDFLFVRYIDFNMINEIMPLFDIRNLESYEVIDFYQFYLLQQTNINFNTIKSLMVTHLSNLYIVYNNHVLFKSSKSEYITKNERLKRYVDQNKSMKTLTVMESFELENILLLLESFKYCFVDLYVLITNLIDLHDENIAIVIDAIVSRPYVSNALKENYDEKSIVLKKSSYESTGIISYELSRHKEIISKRYYFYMQYFNNTLGSLLAASDGILNLLDIDEYLLNIKTFVLQDKESEKRENTTEKNTDDLKLNDVGLIKFVKSDYNRDVIYKTYLYIKSKIKKSIDFLTAHDISIIRNEIIRNLKIYLEIGDENYLMFSEYLQQFDFDKALTELKLLFHEFKIKNITTSEFNLDKWCLIDINRRMLTSNTLDTIDNRKFNLCDNMIDVSSWMSYFLFNKKYKTKENSIIHEFMSLGSKLKTDQRYIENRNYVINLIYLSEELKNIKGDYIKTSPEYFESLKKDLNFSDESISNIFDNKKMKNIFDILSERGICDPETIRKKIESSSEFVGFDLFYVALYGNIKNIQQLLEKKMMKLNMNNRDTKRFYAVQKMITIVIENMQGYNKIEKIITECMQTMKTVNPFLSIWLSLSAKKIISCSIGLMDINSKMQEFSRIFKIKNQQNIMYQTKIFEDILKNNYLLALIDIIDEFIFYILLVICELDRNPNYILNSENKLDTPTTASALDCGVNGTLEKTKKPIKKDKIETENNKKTIKKNEDEQEEKYKISLFYTQKLDLIVMPGDIETLKMVMLSHRIWSNFLHRKLFKLSKKGDKSLITATYESLKEIAQDVKNIKKTPQKMKPTIDGFFISIYTQLDQTIIFYTDILSNYCFKKTNPLINLMFDVYRESYHENILSIVTKDTASVDVISKIEDEITSGLVDDIKLKDLIVPYTNVDKKDLLSSFVSMLKEIDLFSHLFSKIEIMENVESVITYILNENIPENENIKYMVLDWMERTTPLIKLSTIIDIYASYPHPDDKYTIDSPSSKQYKSTMVKLIMTLNRYFNGDDNQIDTLNKNLVYKPTSSDSTEYYNYYIDVLKKNLCFLYMNSKVLLI